MASITSPVCVNLLLFLLALSTVGSRQSSTNQLQEGMFMVMVLALHAFVLECVSLRRGFGVDVGLFYAVVWFCSTEPSRCFVCSVDSWTVLCTLRRLLSECIEENASNNYLLCGQRDFFAITAVV